jgi:hypothetical protein
MDEHDEPLDLKLFELVAKAVKEGLERVEVLKIENKYIGTYFNWPELSYFEGGIPYLREGYSNSGPTDYKYAFRLGKDAPIDVKSLPSFQTLLDYVTAHPTLKDYFGFKEESDNSFSITAVYLLAEYLIDRHIHIHGNTAFNREQLLSSYMPLEAALFKEKLGVNVVVPILFLLFDFDEIRFGPDFGIVRMDDDFQNARATKRTSRLSVHDIVLGAATHALVLNRYEIENGSYFRIFHAYSEATAYPLPIIDAFFTAVRVVTGHPTGYAQLLLEPIGWAHAYKAHLPPMEGTSTRRYPAEFENVYWHRPAPTVTRAEAVRIGETFTKLRNALEVNQLRIASRRLNLCYLREDDEDAILDATIGLESLLVGGERNEITHKLALRMAALSTLDNNIRREAVDVFRDIKEIYKFRSAVAHGSSKSSQKREIAIKEGEAIPIVAAAINYLRIALGIILDHPEYRNPTRIDEVLLLDKISSIYDSPL